MPSNCVCAETIALWTLRPQQAVIFEDSAFEGGVTLEACHHCREGVTGVLCAPTYIFANVAWSVRPTQHAAFNWYTEDANKGKATFVLAPPEESNPNGPRTGRSPTRCMSLLRAGIAFRSHAPTHLAAPLV